MAPKSLLVALAALAAVPVLPALATHAPPDLPAEPAQADAPHEDRFVNAGLPDVHAVLAGLAADTDLTTTRVYGCADDNYPLLGRFQLVYAQPYDQLDAYAANLQVIRDNWEAASGVFMDNGMNPEAPYRYDDMLRFDTPPTLPEPMRLRAQCDETHVPTVAHVWLSTRSGGTTFGSVKDDLVWQGYDRPNTKYVVFVDGGVKTDAAGQGDVQDDDSTGLNNQNNNGAMYAMAYLTNVDVDWLYDTVLHEIGHTMGAVQHSAPHSTAGWHCWDGLDTMCYDDDSARSERYTYTACPARYYGDGPVSVGALLPPPALGTGTEAALVFQMPHSYDAFDCGRDGYFNPHPTRWNYLCTHWNIAARYNRFVEFLAPQVAPPTSDYCY